MRESDSKWRSLVQNVPDIIATFDKSFKLQFLSQDVPPYTILEMMGTSLYELSSHPSIVRLREAIEQVFSIGKMVELDTVAWQINDEARTFELLLLLTNL